MMTFYYQHPVPYYDPIEAYTNYREQSQRPQNITPQYYVMTSPSLYENIKKLGNSSVVVQTTHGSLYGSIIDSKPDILCINSSGKTYYISINQIVWVMKQ